MLTTNLNCLTLRKLGRTREYLCMSNKRESCRTELNKLWARFGGSILHISLWTLRRWKFHICIVKEHRSSCHQKKCSHKTSKLTGHFCFFTLLTYWTYLLTWCALLAGSVSSTISYFFHLIHLPQSLVSKYTRGFLTVGMYAYWHHLKWFNMA